MAAARMGHTIPETTAVYCHVEGIFLSIGFILLILTGALVLFGAGQRVLDRLRLTDRQALLFIALIIGGGLLPDIRVTPRLTVNVGGALVPLALCVYLWVKADTALEQARCLISTLVTGIAVYTVGRLLPADPDRMPFDINYLYGIAAGLIAWVFGRSRRGAFVSGVVGVMLAQTASAWTVWLRGVEQTLALGGAGGFDVIVISGLLAVLTGELVGEVAERAVRGGRQPAREFHGGDFLRREVRR